MSFDWTCHHPDQLGLLITPETVQQHPFIPFEQHPSFALLVDALSRQHQHHVLLEANYHATYHPHYLTAFAAYLMQPATPPSLHHAPILYFNVKQVFAGLNPENARLAISVPLQKRVDEAHSCFILAYTSDPLPASIEAAWEQTLAQLARHPRCRLIQLAKTQHNQGHYLPTPPTPIALSQPSDQETRLTLALIAHELELHHQVSIPTPVIEQALTLAERYLSSENSLEKAMLLLDSSAARTYAKAHASGESQPTVMMDRLTEVLAGWTAIPASHLNPLQFKGSEFTKHVQQRLFGQAPALMALAQQLQESHAKLQTHLGPFFHALLAGPQYVGKTTAVLATLEVIFKQLNLLYVVRPTSSQPSLMHLPAQRYTDKRYFSVQEALAATPHAVFVFESIDDWSPRQREGIEEVLSTGYFHEDNDLRCNFRQAMIFMTINLEAVLFQEFLESSGSLPKEEPSLLQLVMQNTPERPYQEDEHASPEAIVESIRPALLSRLPERLVQGTTVIPFLPLTREALTSAIEFKINQLSKQLLTRYNISLTTAPEVFRTLLANAETHPDGSIDHVLKPLYFCVEQALLARPQTAGGQPGSLNLQLHETGQLLRCEWVNQPQTVT